MSGDDAIARNRFFGHVEIGAAMLNENIPFLETVLIQQDPDTLSRRQFALSVLRFNTPGAAALFGRSASSL